MDVWMKQIYMTDRHTADITRTGLTGHNTDHPSKRVHECIRTPKIVKKCQSLEALDKD